MISPRSTSHYRRMEDSQFNHQETDYYDDDDLDSEDGNSVIVDHDHVQRAFAHARANQAQQAVVNEIQAAARRQMVSVLEEQEREEQRRLQEEIAAAKTAANKKKLQKLEEELELLDSKEFDTKVGLVEQADIGAIFLSFLTESGRQFIETAGHWFLFPIAMVAASIHAWQVWKQADLEKGKDGGYYRAAVEFGAAGLVGLAVLGGMFSQAFAAAASPVIFTLMLACKTLFLGASSLFYLGKSAFANSEAKRFEHLEKHYRKKAEKAQAEPETQARYLELAVNSAKQKKMYQADAAKFKNFAKANAIGFFSCALGTIAVGFVMLAAKPLVGLLGIVSSVIGIGYGIKNYRTLKFEKGKLVNKRDEFVKSITPPVLSDAPKKTVNATMQQALSTTPVVAERKRDIAPAAVSCSSRISSCFSSMKKSALSFWQTCSHAPSASQIVRDEEESGLRAKSELKATDGSPRRQSMAA